MASFGSNLELIPIYLDAKTKDELIRLMFLNNSLNSSKYNYMSPMLEGTTWVVWFYADIKGWNDPRNLDEETEKLLKGFE